MYARIGYKITLIVGAVLIALLVMDAYSFFTTEYRRVKSQIHDEALRFLTSLEAVHTQSMLNRGGLDDDNPAVLTLDGTLSQLSEQQDRIRLWLVMGPKVAAYQQSKGNTVEHPKDDVDREAMRTSDMVFRFINDNEYRLTKPIVLGKGNAVDELCFTCHEGLMGIERGEAIGAISIAYDATVEFAQFRSAAVNFVIATLIVVGLVAVAVVFVVHGVIGKPISRMTESMLRIAEGDLDAPIEGVGRKDEIGEMAKAVQVFKDDRRQLENVGATAVQAAEGVATASVEIAASTSDLSRRTEKNLENLESLSAALFELSTTVSLNAESAEEISSRATTANELANEGGKVVSGAVNAISRIEDSSRQITQIVSVIDEIAFLTNLLSLNAAVEAARAGDAGKGFAVVASEVGKLARRSSDAAKEIKELIDTATSEVDQGVEMVNKSGVAFEEISKTIDALAALVANMASATRDQAKGLQELSSGMSKIETMVQENAALVGQNTSATESLKTQANALTRTMASK